MGASTSSAGPVGKGSNASTSGQPRMGQPSNTMNPSTMYSNTVGGWDQAKIGGQSGQAGGKSGKGSGINTFQPNKFTMPQQNASTPVNQTAGMDFRGQDAFAPAANVGSSFSANMNNFASGQMNNFANSPLGLVVGGIANAFSGPQAPAPVSDIGFAPSIDVGGQDTGGGYGGGNGTAGGYQ